MGGYTANKVSGPWRPYAWRNDALREMGFDSYGEYLSSPLWRDIRCRVLSQAKHGCYICHRPAEEVHHRSYGKSALTGECLKFLVPLCREHHQMIEFSRDGAKRPPPEARKILAKLYRAYHPKLGKYGEILLKQEKNRLPKVKYP